ncbi:MAG: putative integral rane protein [Planctomycetota bacterium]|nr:putative integral rane protein [Planctomycetota bacterium]
MLVASPGGTLPEDLARLVSLRDSSSVTRGILDRVHFGELTTIYPPTAQAVFALAALITPGDASLPVRMTVMNAFFVGFDLATLGLVVALLSLAGRPVGWSVAYGWCPLVVKEVANSGHVDALAYFLATLALYLAARVLFPRHPGAPPRAKASMAAIACGTVLGLAIGAKLYPVILAPLVILGLFRRLGFRRSLFQLAAFGVTSALVVGPMIPSARLREDANNKSMPDRTEEAPPVPPMESFSEPREPGQGLSAFLSQWEMNDFLFLLVMENLRPYAQLTPDEKAWFAVVPERVRGALIAGVRDHLGIEARRVPPEPHVDDAHIRRPGRVARRGIPDGGLVLAPPADREPMVLDVGAAAPAVRPQPRMVRPERARIRLLRPLLAHVPLPGHAGTRYPGPPFFDYVVTWLEFAPWFMWLALETRRSRAVA